MRVFWLFVCIQVGIFALACLSDLIWKKKMKASAQRLGVVCQGCLQRNLAVEISGFWIHQYRDCWISCDAHQQKMAIAETTRVAAPLGEASITSSQIA